MNIKKETILKDRRKRTFWVVFMITKVFLNKYWRKLTIASK
jgi:hypothetical protein